MTDLVASLPAPGTPDIWERLRSEKKPVCIYGTGNGADKIMDELAARGIPVAGVFASDGFVRDREFRGYHVISFEEAKADYGDFTALLAFGTHRPDVIEAIRKVASERTLLCPDVPVFGDVVFDSDYYSRNRDSFARLSDALSDDESRRVLSLVLRSKLSGELESLAACGGEGDILTLTRDIFDFKRYRITADLGAYTGDTAREAAKLMPCLSRIYALEPEPHAYRKLAEYAGCISSPEVIAINAAAWSHDTTLDFTSSSGRGSSGAGRAHRRTKTVPVQARALDNIVGEDNVNFIKMDVEGAEALALRGASSTIRRCRPDLCVSVYHRTEDLLALPALVAELCPGKRLYLRRERCLPAWGIVLCAIE